MKKKQEKNESSPSRRDIPGSNLTGANKSTSGWRLSGKEYFLKNPEGFLFTHLFASNSINENLKAIVKEECTITPVSLQFAPARQLHTLSTAAVSVIRFPDEFPGTAVTLFPLSTLKSAAKKIGFDYRKMVKDVYEPVKTTFGRLFEAGEINVVISDDAKEITRSIPESEELCLWTKYYFYLKENIDFFAVQYISNELLGTISNRYLNIRLTDEITSETEKFLSFVRTLNKEFQSRMIESISSAKEGSISLGQEMTETGGAVEINLEELRLVDDRAFRALLDEISRRRFSQKSFVFALSGMSEELRARFFQNMSRNRRKELREGMSIWEGTREETLEAQRDLAWIIIELTESGGIKLNKRLQSQMESIIKIMDEALQKKASQYIQSNIFGESIEAINDILFQILLRRVSRKLLVSSLGCSNDTIDQKIASNMTPVGARLLNEDIDHWKRTVKNDAEKITSCAAAQREMLRSAIQVKKEFKRSVI